MSTIPIRVLLAVLGLALFVACEDTGATRSTAILTAESTVEVSPSPSPTPSPTPTSTPTPSPTPAPVVDLSEAMPALEILEAAFAAMEAVESMHLEMLAEVNIDTGSTEMTLPIVLVGDYQAPDRFRSTLNVNLGFFSIDTETIAIGDDIYSTDPLTGEWERHSTSESAFAFPAPSDFATGVDLALIDPVLLEIAEIAELEGGKVFRLSGAPPPDVFGAEGALSDAEFWVGVDDFLIYKISAEAEVDVGDLGPLGDAGVSGPATITLTITLSNFGEPVVIEAPELP